MWWQNPSRPWDYGDHDYLPHGAVMMMLIVLMGTVMMVMMLINIGVIPTQ